jgi:hypothetical protein
MKLDSTPPMPNAAAQQFTRANQAWAIDFAVLDFAEGPLVRLVVDVGTRRPLSATLTLAVDDDIAAGLDRLARRSGRPEQIWLDNRYEFRFDPALRSWAERHSISIIYVPMRMPQMKSLSERLLGDLSAYLRDKRFPTLMELGHDIEHWRQRYCAAAQPFATSISKRSTR